MSPDPLAAVLGADPPAFALLHRAGPERAWPPRSPHRPAPAQSDRVELLVGEPLVVDRLADLPLPPLRASTERHDLLALVPYRQLTERGFACHDDGTPLSVLRVCAQWTLPVADVRDALPRDRITLAGEAFEPDDDEYRAIVDRVRTDEIGRGEGSNFVIRRRFVATIPRYSVRAALAVFGRLLDAERGAYWTFIVHCAGRTLVGATPERHLTLAGGTALMTPISGTYRYPPAGPDLAGLLRFLADRKETDELHMVLDEELKMMGQLCTSGGRLTGPYLRPMARLAHTEYAIAGRTGADVRDLLRSSMFAPTVTGSPIQNACRVIARHEPGGRGYYGGALALIGQRAGRRTLDAAIAIRTADIDRNGRVEIGVGATLVRDSDPGAEADETRAKAATLIAAIRGDAPPSGAGAVLPSDPRVRRALRARTARLSRFWQDPVRSLAPALVGTRVLVVDAEDAFTAMLAHQVRALGSAVTVRRLDAARFDAARFDAVVVGPGPGDPRDLTDPKIAALRELTRRLLAGQVPMLSICLGHQVLAGLLGLPLHRNATPTQGIQREIEFLGRPERVGFYNTFYAYASADRLDGSIDVSRDAATGEVFGLHGPRMCSVQFHPESVLTENGATILRDLLGRVIQLGC